MAQSTFDQWIAALGYGHAKASLHRVAPKRLLPYLPEITDLLDKRGNFRLSALFTVEGTPSIAFIEATRTNTFNEKQLPELRQRLWNQNLVSALLVIDGDTLEAFSVVDPTASERLQLSDAAPLGRWSAAEVQSAAVQQRLTDWFNPAVRVDKQLLRSLELTVQRLIRNAKLDRLDAQLLMAQVLFISYLEHRGIVGAEYRDKHNLGPLIELVAQAKGKDVDRLIKQLKQDLNGDFLSPDEIAWSKLHSSAFLAVDDFLKRVSPDTGQGDFWNYDFSQIPVELLSGIYETFLQDEKNLLGAYYTPRALATLTVEQATADIEDITATRVFDGACGSGILLTTLYRKMLLAAELQQGKPPSLLQRISLLRKNIFGADISLTACRVTAFSLYLCLLERLEPSDIARLRAEHDSRLPPLLGTNILHGPKNGDFFSSRNEFANSARFDIVLSNPPWREPSADEEPSHVNWADKNAIFLPHKQIAAAFAYHCRDALNSSGRLVLILPLSLFTAPTNAQFLRTLIFLYKVQRIINFADFRRLLFPQAEHGCVVLVAQPRENSAKVRITASEAISYWTPKIDLSFALNRLTLHANDRCQIPAADLAQGNASLRERYWGSDRDLRLLSRLRLYPRIRDRKQLPDGNAWFSGKGFHVEDRHRKPRPAKPLRELKFMDAEALQGDDPLADAASLKDLPPEIKTVANYGSEDGRLFRGPRVIWPDGTSPEFAIRAVFAEQSFSFKSSVGAIAGPNKDRGLLRFLALYLRSSLAQYQFILTGYTPSGERARITVAEIEALPFLSPDKHPRPDYAASVMKKALDILDAIEAQPSIVRGSAHTNAKAQIDDLVAEYFELSNDEKILVSDTVRYIAGSMQPTSYEDLYRPLHHVPGSTEIDKYRRTLAKALIDWRGRRKGAGNIEIEVVQDSGSSLLAAVEIKASQHSERLSGPQPARNFEQLLQLIVPSVSSDASENFFAFPNLAVFSGESLFLIKPLRRRFWLQSTALKDADEIVRQISNYRPNSRLAS